jgi:sugar phosphate isomerase/epimerase
MSKFTLSAFGDEISPHLDEQIKVLKQNDIHYLELRNIENQCIIDYSSKEIKETHKVLDGAGIGVSAVASPIGKISITDDFQPHLNRFQKTLETARLLDTNNIRMFSFYMPQGADPANYRDEVLDRWNKFLFAAKGSGLTLLHENEKSIYGDTAARCLDLLETLNNSQVKAVFDPANFVQCGVAAYPDAFNLLKGYVVYMHIKDALFADRSVVPAGEGDGKVNEILIELDKMGYEGFLSIEPHLNSNEPGGGPEKFVVAANAIKKLLAGLK